MYKLLSRNLWLCNTGVTAVTVMHNVGEKFTPHRRNWQVKKKERRKNPILTTLNAVRKWEQSSNVRHGKLMFIFLIFSSKRYWKTQQGRAESESLGKKKKVFFFSGPPTGSSKVTYKHQRLSPAVKAVCKCCLQGDSNVFKDISLN